MRIREVQPEGPDQEQRDQDRLEVRAAPQMRRNARDQHRNGGGAVDQKGSAGADRGDDHAGDGPASIRAALDEVELSATAGLSMRRSQRWVSAGLT